MDKIKEWDHWVLDNIYQKIADLVWGIVPISCFTLARICIVLNETLDAIQSNYPHLISAVIGIIIITMSFNTIRQAEESSHGKFRNIFRELYWYVRPIGIIVLAPEMIRSPYIVLFISCMYFFACQKRPPIERTVLRGVFEGVS